MSNLKNIYLANLNVGITLLHNLHWNVVGPQFKAVHEYLEVLYDDAFEKFDEVAERMKMDGEMPAASVKEYLELSDIEELEVKDWPVKDSFVEARKYMDHMRKAALAIREEAGEDFAWANMMEDHVAGYDKQIWFIDQSLKA